MWDKIFQNVIAPLIVGIITTLFAWWLDKQDDD